MTPIRVFLVDDHSVLRRGLQLLIDGQFDMTVVGDAGSGRDTLAAIAAAGGADVVVLDVSMPEVHGSQVARDLHTASPNVKIIALTRHAERAYVQQMLASGASGYVLKQTAAEVLITAIRTVVTGGTFLDPAIAGKVIDSGMRSPRGTGTGELTGREHEVLTLVAYGHTNKEIAARLGITVKTVETHKTNAMQKLEITSRAEVVRFALEQGWLEK